ncbi:MAG: hypothetical protein M3535_02900 [Actinomycetota bacterium]|jgi:hypothetical protein|nr:hypothetical protein [Actinomycetota bacterium]
MPVDERSRHQLFNHLEDVLGPDDAATLIEHLPPVGGADVATKADVESLEVRMNQRFDQVEARFDGRFSRVDEQFARVDERLEGLKESVELKLQSLKNELLAAFRQELNAQTKFVVFGLVTIVMTMASLAFALVRFT